MPAALPIAFTLNGQPVTLLVDPDMPLVPALRDHTGLAGTKYSCLQGACTMWLDGDAVRSCVLPVAQMAGRSVTTIEGLAGADVEALRAAWLPRNVAPCGWCHSAQLMHAAALLPAWCGQRVADAVAAVLALPP